MSDETTIVLPIEMQFRAEAVRVAREVLESRRTTGPLTAPSATPPPVDDLLTVADFIVGDSGYGDLR
jgi:hypothetical protein